MRKFNFKKLAVLTVLVLVVTCMMATTAFAAGTGDVAGAVEGTWATASGQIKSVVNNVVFLLLLLVFVLLLFLLLLLLMLG